MSSIAIVSGLVIVGLSLVHDVSGTVKLITIVITVRGITWLAKKVTGSINLEHSQIIDFAGWCIAGISIVGLISNAKYGIEPVLGKMNEMGGNIGKWVELADKITFWN